MPTESSISAPADENLLHSYPLAMMADSFKRKLLAENKSPRTRTGSRREVSSRLGPC